MELILKLVTVFGLGAVELWAAIPAGLALKLNPLVTGITAAAGTMLAVLVVVFLGERVRGWLARWRKAGSGAQDQGRQGRQGRAFRIWNRYGVVGLGLLAPLITGAPLGAALAVTLGAATRRLVFWMGVGIALWSALLTAAGALGFVGAEKLMER